MAARDNEIGRCRCPVCDSDRARLRVNTKQLAYVVCDACNLQVFARSDRSDEKLRARHIAEPATPDPAPAPTPAALPAPAAAPAPAHAAAPTPQPAPAAKPAMKWGAFPWLN